MVNLYKFNFMWIIAIMNFFCAGQNTSRENFGDLREIMVKHQIEERGVKNKLVLNAMRKVERHKFVPLELQNQAYNDYPLSIGEGQTISQPYVVAAMTELLNLDSTKNVLEIGTGSGYQAAILAEICDTVYTIEIIKSLGENAQKIFSELGYHNIKSKIADGYKGWQEYAPFDAIIVTCAPTHIPKPLQDQLKEGGKMIIPYGERSSQELVVLTKANNKIRQEYVFSVRFVPMKDEKGNNY
jgi:protein-L-isoaspartate(D-aspartate) O-methyltransferase